jgi:hypothetical protein
VVNGRISEADVPVMGSVVVNSLVMVNGFVISTVTWAG